MKTFASLLAIAAAAIAAPAAASATFIVQIGSPVGTPSCGSVSSGVSSSPVARELACSAIGGASLLDGRAAATFGHVGGSTTAAVGSGYFGTAFGISTQSTFIDFVTFTSDDPSVTHVPIAANLAFSGMLNSTSFADAGVDILYAIDGVGGFFFSANDNTGVARNDFIIASGGVSAAASDALFRTPTLMAPVDQPLRMTFQLTTGAGVGGSGSPESATSSFSNSFEVPFGMDAFVLPDGVTANAGDWLVNNRRVGGPTAVPEPATWALMILGFGVAGGLMRRRRTFASQLTYQ